MQTNQHQEDLFTLFKNAFLYFIKDIYIVLIGLLTTFMRYLLPIHNIVQLIVIFFILDVLFGYWAAKVVKQQKFSVKLIWQHTVPRMIVSLILIVCTFMWDSVYKVEIIHTYKIVGWFISGVLLASVVDNAYKITKWSAFPQIGKLIDKVTKEKTNLDLNDNDNQIKN